VNTSSDQSVSGLLWIVFSPLALLMALIAEGGSQTDYYAGVAACGTWSACGVISGIGAIAGARWAKRVQTVLCWIAFAFCSIPAAILLFFAYKTRIGYVAVIALAMLVAAMPIVVGAWRRRQPRIP